MKTDKKFDNIIKEKLGSFEEAPPPYMWDKIANGVASSNTAATTFYQNIWFKVASIAASIIMIIGLSWLISNNKTNTQTSNSTDNITQPIQPIAQSNNTNTPTNNYNKENSTPKEEKETVININTNNQNIIKQKNIANKNTANLVNNKSSEPIHKNTISSIEPYTIKSNNTLIVNNNKPKRTTTTLIESNAAEKSAPKNIIVTEEKQLVKNAVLTTVVTKEITKDAITTVEKSQSPISTEEPIATKQEIESNKENSITNIENTPIEDKIVSKDNEDNKIAADFNPKTREFNKYGLGIHYGYENIWLNEESIKNNNIDLSFNYRNLSFIFQTGIGGQFSNDNNIYNLEYKRNDYLTTEMRFDSAQFIVDTSGVAQLIPINPYYEDIYDSVNHTYNDEFTESYYSIRIPLLVGYQKDFGKFGIFAKGGFIYSVLVTKKRSAVYSPDDASRIVMLQYSGSKRTNTHMQYVLAVGFEYRINKKFQIQTDLMGKYYHSSIYDNTIYNNKKPWSLEGRVGLVYFLN